MRLAQSKASELQKNLTTTLSLPFQPVAMSHCVSVPALESAPNWKRERTEREQEEEGGGVSHVQNHHPTLSFPSMPDDDFTELTWKNGNPTVHGLGEFIRSTHTKPVPNLNWAETGGTLESVIHQATRHCREPNIQLPDAHESGQNPAIVYSVVGSTGVINTETDSFTDYSGRTLANPTGFEPVKKGTWSRNGLPLPFKELACKKTNQTESVSGSATIGREAETTLTTWVSFESPASTRTKSADKADCTSNRKRQPETDVEDDSACGGRQRNKEAPHKGEGGRSLSTKRSRAAAVHNQLERKRRDRINQKIRALQKLVPNSSKTDKASMLDEVIQYLKQLQAQLQLMSLKNMPHMMMPLGLQQQLMMPYMTPMSMGMGLGMGIGTMDLSTGGSHAIPPLLYPTATTTAAPAFVPLPLASPLMPTHATTHADPNPKPNLAASMPTTCPEFLTQSMNLDHYRKMVALYHQLYQCLPATASVPVSCNPKEVTLNSSTKG